MDWMTRSDTRTSTASILEVCVASRDTSIWEYHFLQLDTTSSTASSLPECLRRKGQSVFHPDRAHVVCLMNSSSGRSVLESLNPSVSFQAGDGARVCRFRPIEGASTICERLEIEFVQHESHREPSVEFCRPGPSPWRRAQEWAQAAVDRPDGTPRPLYEPEYNPEPPSDHLSYALGVALGRLAQMVKVS